MGTLTPGKRADLTVVSLAGSPYHPVEDPAAAVVFGGSPERVLETIVDGHTRYANEDNEQWREVRSTASAARQRMLARGSSSTETAEAARVAGAAVLSAAPQPREVGVRRSRRSVRARLRPARCRLGLDGRRRRAGEHVQLRVGWQRHVDLQAPEEGRREPQEREGVARSRDRPRAEAAHAGRRERARALHGASTRRTRTRSPSLLRNTGPSRRTTRRTTRTHRRRRSNSRRPGPSSRRRRPPRSARPSPIRQRSRIRSHPPSSRSPQASRAPPTRTSRPPRRAPRPSTRSSRSSVRMTRRRRSSLARLRRPPGTPRSRSPPIKLSSSWRPPIRSPHR